MWLQSVLLEMVWPPRDNVHDRFHESDTANPYDKSKENQMVDSVAAHFYTV